ncbi:MAG: hypothetical protein ABSD76_12110 [Terriglobales bacterium]
MSLRVPRRMAVLAALTFVAFLSGCQKQHRAVTTYHYDNLRTGWNHEEKELKYDKVQSAHFGLIQNVTLDDQVDTQPLVVPHVDIPAGPSPGVHDVVYVATESNTIYAIDASSGEILLHPKFGNPVPLPQGCNNNGPNVGINGTPVIDRASNTMYVIVYTLVAGAPTYHIHALDLNALTDKVPPRVVAASFGAFTFQAAWQRQRPALLLANGNVYAGFGSFCDWGGTHSRGWLLGWQTGSLTPLPANQLNDREATAPNSSLHRFLASIWMSGYGPAADEAGNLFFVTGNSDSNYNVPISIQESVVKMSPDLTTIRDFFTPSNEANLDSGDTDYGSGGAMLLPDQSGSTPHLIAAAGKDGRMFILNRESMGGSTPGGPDKVVTQANIGGCWCGPSYFHHKIVSSGGSNVILWRIQTSPSTSLQNEGTSEGIGGGAQDPGFFTTVSSDEDDHPIIWAVSRPSNSSPADISLFAFKAEPSSSGALDPLFQAPAGTWPNTGGNSNIVPVVANGKVYVASYKQLSIFGMH